MASKKVMQTHPIRFPPAELSALKAEAKRNKTTVSEVVRLAVRKHMAPEESAESYFDIMFKRMNRQKTETVKLQKYMTALSEAFLLFAKYFFVVTPEIPDEVMADAKFHGTRRYDAFVKTFRTVIAEGGILHQLIEDEAGRLNQEGDEGGGAI